MTGKHKGESKAGHSARSLDQTDTQRWQGDHDNPAKGRRSNPGNVEAGVGHTRGHDRPGTNTGGRGRDAED